MKFIIATLAATASALPWEKEIKCGFDAACGFDVVIDEATGCGFDADIISMRPAAVAAVAANQADYADRTMGKVMRKGSRSDAAVKSTYPGLIAQEARPADPGDRLPDATYADSSDNFANSGCSGCAQCKKSSGGCGGCSGNCPGGTGMCDQGSGCRNGSCGNGGTSTNDWCIGGVDCETSSDMVCQGNNCDSWCPNASVQCILNCLPDDFSPCCLESTAMFSTAWRYALRCVYKCNHTGPPGGLVKHMRKVLGAKWYKGCCGCFCNFGCGCNCSGNCGPCGCSSCSGNCQTDSSQGPVTITSPLEGTGSPGSTTFPDYTKPQDVYAGHAYGSAAYGSGSAITGGYMYYDAQCGFDQKSQEWVDVKCGFDNNCGFDFECGFDAECGFDVVKDTKCGFDLKNEAAGCGFDTKSESWVNLQCGFDNNCGFDIKA